MSRWMDFSSVAHWFNRWQRTRAFPWLNQWVVVDSVAETSGYLLKAEPCSHLWHFPDVGLPSGKTHDIATLCDQGLIEVCSKFGSFCLLKNTILCVEACPFLFCMGWGRNRRRPQDIALHSVNLLYKPDWKVNFMCMNATLGGTHWTAQNWD